MKRINWLEKISKTFKNEEFSLDDLCEKTKQSRDKSRNAINRNINTGNIISCGNGMYRLKGSKQNNETLHKKRFRILSEKFGDESFTIDDIFEVWNIKREQIHAIMHNATNNNLVKRIEKGVYKLTDKTHNIVAEEIKAAPKKEEFKSPSCLISRIEAILGEDRMKDWVYRIAMSNEECIKVLEEEAVKDIAKTVRLN